MLYFIKNNPEKLYNKYKSIKSDYIEDKKMKETIIYRLIELKADIELLEIFSFDKKNQFIQNYLCEKYKENPKKLLWLYNCSNLKKEIDNRIISRLIELDAEDELLKLYEIEKSNYQIRNYLFERYKDNPDKLYWLYYNSTEKQIIINRLIKLDAENELLEIFKSDRSKTVQKYLFEKYSFKKYEGNDEKLSWLFSNYSNVVDYYIWRINKKTFNYKKFYVENIHFLKLLKYDPELLLYVFDKLSNKYKQYLLLSCYGISKFVNNTPEYVFFPELKEFYPNVINSKYKRITEFSNLFEKVYNIAEKEKSENLFRLAYLLDRSKYIKKIDVIKNNKTIVKDIIEEKKKINSKFSDKIVNADSKQNVENLLKLKANEISRLYSNELFSMQNAVIKRDNRKIIPYPFPQKAYLNISNEPYTTTSNQLCKSYTIVKDKDTKVLQLSKDLKKILLNLDNSDEIMKAKSSAQNKISKVISEKEFIKMIEESDPELANENIIINKLGKILIKDIRINIVKTILTFSTYSNNTLWLKYILKTSNLDRLKYIISISIRDKFSTGNFNFIGSLCNSSDIISKRSIKGHSYMINCVAFSPDGEMIVSGSNDDKTIKLWDVNTGNEIKTFHYHSSYSAGFNCIAFSPDGEMIVSGSGFSTVKLWDVSTGKGIKSFQGHSGSINSVAFSPDGEMIVSGSNDDKTIKLWDVSTGKEIKSFQGHSYSINSVAFSPDGEMIVSGGNDKTIKLWDVSTGKEIKSFQDRSGRINNVAFSPDGKMIVSGSKDDKIIKLWDVNTGKEIKSFQGNSGSINSVAFSPDGEMIISGSNGDKTIKLWDVSTGKWIKSFKSHSGSIESVAFSPDGEMIVSGNANGTIEVWDISSYFAYKNANLLLTEHLLYFLLNPNPESLPDLIKFKNNLQKFPQYMQEPVKENITTIIERAGKQSKSIELINKNKPKSIDIEIKH